MHYRRTLAVALTGGLSVGAVALIAIGCAALPPNSFLDPTKVGEFPLEGKENGIRRVLTPRDTPAGLANATEPTPEDVVPGYDEYRIGPGDAITVSIQDLNAPGETYAAVHEVTSAGDIRIPQVGAVKVAGLTESEIEREITARLKENDILPNPIVAVFPQLKRSRTYNIIGSIQAPGTYPISDPDMRLLDAISLARGTGADARRAYVIRRGENRVRDAVPQQRKPAPADDGLIIPPPDEPERSPQPGSFMATMGRARQDQGAPPQEPPPTRDELENVITPRQASRPAEKPGAGDDRAYDPLVFDPQTGRLLEPEKKGTAKREAAPGAPKAHEQPFDWEDVPEYEQTQRVIGVDLRALNSGDPRSNIVIRQRDTIYIPVDIGVFYMMGEIARPGVYSFGGREITIKQAVATAGGFTPLAWPTRCEIIRHELGSDKQVTIPVNLDSIFGGREDDVLLRDEDIVNVGTDVIAPFLYVIRNSFRFTYGFGFVYDRNYADQDSYEARANPYNVKVLERQRRGLPF